MSWETPHAKSCQHQNAYNLNHTQLYSGDYKYLFQTPKAYKYPQALHVRVPWSFPSFLFRSTSPLFFHRRRKPWFVWPIMTALTIVLMWTAPPHLVYHHYHCHFACPRRHNTAHPHRHLVMSFSSVIRRHGRAASRSTLMGRSCTMALTAPGSVVCSRTTYGSSSRPRTDHLRLRGAHQPLTYTHVRGSCLSSWSAAYLVHEWR